ncbi:MAG: hypothetical protein DRP01_03720 [Archaeoglobales archaeon]|nr:MAG: hypothetical protein DRP01_03720 [Archaeoglobales archaeon]
MNPVYDVTPSYAPEEMYSPEESYAEEDYLTPDDMYALGLTGGHSVYPGPEGLYAASDYGYY